MLYFQTETWDGFVGQSDEEEKTDKTNARELKKKKTWRELPRPQTLLYILGDLCPGRHTVHIITFVWIWTHRSGPLQKAEYGEFWPGIGRTRSLTWLSLFAGASD